MAPNVNANKVDAIERLQEEFKEWEKNHPQVHIKFLFLLPTCIKNM